MSAVFAEAALLGFIAGVAFVAVVAYVLRGRVRTGMRRRRDD